MQDQSKTSGFKFVAGVVIASGVLTLFGAHPAGEGLLRAFFNLALWPSGSQMASAPEVRLLAAILGGVSIGWGVMIWLLAVKQAAADAIRMRTILLVGAGTWFVCDSIGSIVAGAPMNAALNVVFLALVALPLWRSGAQRGAAA